MTPSVTRAAVLRKDLELTETQVADQLHISTRDVAACFRDSLKEAMFQRVSEEMRGEEKSADQLAAKLLPKHTDEFAAQ